MRKSILLPALVIALGSFGFAGCADSGTGSTDASSNIDGGAGADTSGDAAGADGVSEQDGTTATDNGTQDVPAVDPCVENPCGAKASTCDGDATVQFSEPVCENVDGEAVCTYTEASDPCDAGWTCVKGACVEAGDPNSYVFSDEGTILTSLAIGGVGDAEPCCFDFDDDGEINNALGKLLNGLGNILGDTDVNLEITSNMTEGSLAILFNYKGLDDLVNDDTVDMAVFYGEDTDDDYADNLAGTGDFLVDPTSFVEGTMVPMANFPGAKIQNGIFSAGPSVFNLAFPIGNIKLLAAVSGALIEAEVSAGPSGKGLAFTGGKLGGYIRMEDLYGALNSYVSGGCECLGLSGELIEYNEAKGKMACASVDNSSCDSNDPDQETCAQLGSFCGAALLFLKPDIDSDDDGEKDAMSVGAWVSGTSATITGLLGAE